MIEGGRRPWRGLLVPLLALAVATAVLGLGALFTRSADPPLPLEASIVETFPPFLNRDYKTGERYLLSLVAPLDDLVDEPQVGFVDVNDPNGDARVGTDWTWPRVVANQCTYVVDRGAYPLVDVWFYTGPAEYPLTPEDETSYSMWLAVLDNADQQADVFETEKAAADILDGCTVQDDELAASVPDVIELPPLDIGHPGFGRRYESADGVQHLYQYAVGDRVVLRAGYAEPFSDGDLSSFEAWIRRQVDRLESAGLTTPTTTQPSGPGGSSQADGADATRSDADRSPAPEACRPVMDAGLLPAPDAESAIVSMDVDVDRELLHSTELFLGRSPFVDEVARVAASDDGPTEFILRFEPGISAESIAAIAAEVETLAGVSLVTVLGECG